MKFEYAPGATPIDSNEAAGLIPAHLTLQRELNEYEEANILEGPPNGCSHAVGAIRWMNALFTSYTAACLFNQTWKWAGKPRRSDKNIGVSWYEIPVRLRQMLGDVRAQIQHSAYSPNEIAARYHHRLVVIHVYPNGNGRHARLMADLLLTQLAGRQFEWGRGSLVAANELRARYIAALRAADAGDCRPLLEFLESV